jgi:hypothetical protein
MVDRIITQPISCRGGLNTAMDYLQQASDAPGSAVQLINYEPMVDGGYSRIEGYTRFDPNVVPGTGPIRGVAVFDRWIIACRGPDIYRSTGAGWTKINGSSTYPGATWFRFATYNFSAPMLVGVDGAGQPFSVDAIGDFTELAGAPNGASSVTEYKGRLWFAAGNLVTFTAPYTDNDFTAANGAGQVNIGGTVQAVRGWRDQLIIFSIDRVQRLTGDTKDTFVLKPITLSLGCTHPDTVVEVGGNLVFLSHDGLRTIAGTDNQDGFNVDNVARPIQKRILDMKRVSPRIISVVLRNKLQMRLLSSNLATLASVTEGYTGTMRDTEGAWEWGELRGIKAYVAHSGINDGGNEVVAFGGDTGYIYRMDSGYSFDGDPIEAVYQTPHLVFGDIGVRKKFRRLNTILKTDANYTIEVQLLLDMLQNGMVQPAAEVIARTQLSISTFGSALFGSSTFGGTLSPIEPLQLVGTGFSGSFVFKSKDTFKPHSIHSLAVDLSTEGRK